MLIKCPECGNDVSELAERCPHCGMPFKPDILSLLKTCAGGMSSATLKTGKSLRSWFPTVKRIALFSLSLLVFGTVWWTCYFIASVVEESTRHPSDRIFLWIIRPAVNLALVWSARIWISSAARQWPKTGFKAARIIFTLGFVIGTLNEFRFAPDWVLVVACVIARLAAVPLAIRNIGPEFKATEIVPGEPDVKEERTIPDKPARETNKCEWLSVAFAIIFAVGLLYVGLKAIYSF